MSVTSEATTLWFGDLLSGSGTTTLDSSDAAEFPVSWEARSKGAAGKTNREIRRCLKRYICRQIFHQINTIMS